MLKKEMKNVKGGGHTVQIFACQLAGKTCIRKQQRCPGLLCDACPPEQFCTCAA